MPLFFHIIFKDIRILLFRSNGIIQSIMLGLLLIVLFSLAQKVGDPITPQTASCLFTLASVFCVILITNTLFSIEEQSGIHTQLILSSLSITSFALGKAGAMLLLLSITQFILLPATLILFDQYVHHIPILFLGILFLNAGTISAGTLLGAMTQHTAAKDSILTVLLFPLLLPLLLATIRIIEYAYTLDAPSISSWIGIALAFVLFFFVALLILFPLLFSDS